MGILELAAGPGRLEHIWGSPPGSLGELVGVRVGGSERVCACARGRGDRRAGGRKGAGWGVCGEGRGASGRARK